MHNFRQKKSIPFILLLVMAISCQNYSPLEVLPWTSAEEPLVGTSETDPVFTHQAKINGLRLPDSTRVQLITTEDGKKIEYKFPAGYRFIYKDARDNMNSTELWYYLCSCPGGSCDPYYGSNGVPGCLRGGCLASCAGMWVKDTDFHDRLVGERRYPEGGFLDLSKKGSTYVRSKEELKSLVVFDSIILQIPEVARTYKLMGLNELDYVSADPNYPNCPTKSVAVNFYGTLIGVEVPVAYIEANGGNDAFLFLDCVCLVGSSGCDKEPINGITVCRGNGCEGCAIGPLDPPDGKD